MLTLAICCLTAISAITLMTYEDRVAAAREAARERFLSAKQAMGWDRNQVEIECAREIEDAMDKAALAASQEDDL